MNKNVTLNVYGDTKTQHKDILLVELLWIDIYRHPYYNGSFNLTSNKMVEHLLSGKSITVFGHTFTVKYCKHWQ